MSGILNKINEMIQNNRKKVLAVGFVAAFAGANKIASSIEHNRLHDLMPEEAKYAYQVADKEGQVFDDQYIKDNWENLLASYVQEHGFSNEEIQAALDNVSNGKGSELDNKIASFYNTRVQELDEEMIEYGRDIRTNSGMYERDKLYRLVHYKQDMMKLGVERPDYSDLNYLDRHIAEHDEKSKEFYSDDFERSFYHQLKEGSANINHGRKAYSQYRAYTDEAADIGDFAKVVSIERAAREYVTRDGGVMDHFIEKTEIAYAEKYGKNPADEYEWYKGVNQSEELKTVLDEIIGADKATDSEEINVALFNLEDQEFER